ncbi:MAG: hypothetical protein PUC50_15260 [Bacteroidales bacterium]|nr:hypothetical protein [Bacteroidales bacterium]
MTAFDFITDEFFNSEKTGAPIPDVKVSSKELATELQEAVKLFQEDKTIFGRAEKQINYIADMFFKPGDRSHVISRLSKFCYYGDLW